MRVQYIPTMAHHEEQQQPHRPFPQRTSSRFAPGIYFNLEWGVSLAPERPAHLHGVNFTSRRMQERFQRDERDRTGPSQHLHSEYTRYPPRPYDASDRQIDPQTRDFQHERQRRSGIRPLEQHQRGSSAPPSLDRDDSIRSQSPEPVVRPIIQTSSFPPERLDHPLPYSPASFRLGEDDLPWTVPPWYRSPEPEFVSPILPGNPSASQLQQLSSHSPRGSPSRGSIHSMSKTSMSSSSRSSVVDPLPSLGFESTGQRDPRSSPRCHESSNVRAEDPQRVHDLGQLHSAMLGVEGPHNDGGWELWGWEDGVGDMPRGPRSLGWAVRTEPMGESSGGIGFGGYGGGGGAAYGVGSSFERDFIGFYAPGLAGDRNSEILMSPPPGYVDSQWEEMGRRMAMRPRTSGS